MSSISWTRTVSQRCHWVVVPTLALMLACTQTPNEPEMHADVVQSTMRDVQQAQDDVPQSSMNSMPDVQQALTDGGRSSVPDATDSAVADVASGEALDASSDTWNSYAQMWFQTFCTSCHGAGNTRRDYTQLSQVQRDVVPIRCGVTPDVFADCSATGIPRRQFPVGTGPRPSDVERRRLVTWLQATGARQ